MSQQKKNNLQAVQQAVCSLQVLKEQGTHVLNASKGVSLHTFFLFAVNARLYVLMLGRKTTAVLAVGPSQEAGSSPFFQETHTSIRRSLQLAIYRHALRRPASRRGTEVTL